MIVVVLLRLITCSSAPQLRCRVMLQKESAEGLRDEPCGKDADNGCAGLCKYVSY